MFDKGCDARSISAPYAQLRETCRAATSLDV